MKDYKDLNFNGHVDRRKKILTETLPHGSLVPWKRRRGGCFSSAGELPGRFTAGAHACIGEGEKEPEPWPLPLPTSAAKSTLENKQKGNHGNHAREVFFAAFGVFCGGSTAPLTGPAYVLQRLQRVEWSRVEGHVSGVDGRLF